MRGAMLRPLRVSAGYLAALALPFLVSRSASRCAPPPPPNEREFVRRATFEPCPEVACKSKEELMALFGGNLTGSRARRSRATIDGSGSEEESGRRSGGGSGGASSPPDTPAASSAIADSHGGCPPNRQELGNHAWSFVSA